MVAPSSLAGARDMPINHFEVDLSTSNPQVFVPKGATALSLIVTDATPGIEYEIRLGTDGDWSGPYLGQGKRVRTFRFGSGLPLSDRTNRIFMRAVNPVPGAYAIVDVSFGGEG